MMLIHTALPAESRALIQHFGLKRLYNERAFTCYASQNTWLIESGIGKINAAAAVAWLSAKAGISNPVWLNIGIAGHACMPLGTLHRAHRIEDGASGRRWYPPGIFEISLEGKNLITLDTEAKEYEKDTMVDMEASGFINAANRFSTLELIQSLKIISDNQDNPPRRFKTSEVETMITPHLKIIAQLGEQLCQAREEIVAAADIENEDFIKHWKFSQYQIGRLQRLLQRYRTLYPGEKLLGKIPPELKQSKDVLNYISTLLNETEIQY